MSLKRAYRYNFVLVSVAILLVEIIFWIVWFGVNDYLATNVSEFRFERKWTLNLLWCVPIVIALFYLLLLWRNKAFSKLADKRLLPYLSKGISKSKSVLKFIFFRLGISFIIIAIANPQYGINEKLVKSKGIEIMLAIDVSNSMLAEDLSEKYNRLKIAKLAIEKFIDNLHGDFVGIVVFAGGAYKHLPLTSDYKAAKMFVNSITTKMMTAQGTDIGKAIETCMTSFDFENATNKAIIVFSDGEDHEEEGINEAMNAAEKGAMVSTIGMGTTEGVPIPIYSYGRFIENKKDENGETVLTKLNELNLIEIAEAGDGVYVRANGMSVGLDGILNKVNEIEKKTLSTEMYAGYDDQFQPFLLIGILFIVLEILINEKRSLWIDKINIG